MDSSLLRRQLGFSIFHNIDLIYNISLSVVYRTCEAILIIYLQLLCRLLLIFDKHVFLPKFWTARIGNRIKRNWYGQKAIKKRVNKISANVWNFSDSKDSYSSTPKKNQSPPKTWIRERQGNHVCKDITRSPALQKQVSFNHWTVH